MCVCVVWCVCSACVCLRERVSGCVPERKRERDKQRQTDRDRVRTDSIFIKR